VTEYDGQSWYWIIVVIIIATGLGLAFGWVLTLLALP